MMRQHKPLRPDEMRARAQQYLPFPERLANEAELERFEVAQPAVDQLGGGRGRRSAKIALVAEIDGKAAACCIACDAAAVDAAAYDGKIEDQLAQPLAILGWRLFVGMAQKAIRGEIGDFAGWPRNACLSVDVEERGTS
jgi:hypothetical protein